MDLLISFLIALGIISSGNISKEKAFDLAKQNHEQLTKTYGDQYLKIVGTDNTEKD